MCRPTQRCRGHGLIAEKSSMHMTFGPVATTESAFHLPKLDRYCQRTAVVHRGHVNNMLWDTNRKWSSNEKYHTSANRYASWLRSKSIIALRKEHNRNEQYLNALKVTCVKVRIRSCLFLWSCYTSRCGEKHLCVHLPTKSCQTGRRRKNKISIYISSYIRTFYDQENTRSGQCWGPE